MAVLVSLRQYSPCHYAHPPRLFLPQPQLISIAVTLGGLWLSLKLTMKVLDPYREQREAARKRAAFLQKRLGRAVQLNEFEQLLAGQARCGRNIRLCYALSVRRPPFGSAPTVSS